MHLRPFSYAVFNADSESVFSDFLSCLELKKLELKVFQNHKHFDHISMFRRGRPAYIIGQVGKTNKSGYTCTSI